MIIHFGGLMNDNPLRQYFRRPSIYLKLPSGGRFYPEGSIDLPDTKEIPIFPMTAIDEITSKTPDALFNGSAVAEIIKSCVPNIKDPWEIPNMDMDPILIAIRSASEGDGMDVTSTCPKCENEGNYGISLVGLLSSLKAGDYDTLYNINELKIKFKPLTYRDTNKTNAMQFEIQRTLTALETMPEDQRALATSEALKNISNMGILLVSSAIESITAPNIVVDNKEYILDFLRNCDSTTFESIRDQMVKLRQTSEIKPIKIKCVSCSHEYDQSIALNVADFFG